MCCKSKEGLIHLQLNNRHKGLIIVYVKLLFIVFDNSVSVTAIGQDGYVVTGYTQARRILREHTKHEAWQSVR